MYRFAGRAEEDETTYAILGEEDAVLDLCLHVDGGLQRLGVGLWFEEGWDGDEDAGWWGRRHFEIVARALNVGDVPRFRLHGASLDLLFVEQFVCGTFPRFIASAIRHDSVVITPYSETRQPRQLTVESG